MRDGLKKRIVPKTTGLKKNVNTFSKYNVQYKSKVYQQNVVPSENSCKYDAACKNGKSKPLNRRRYYAPFRQPVLGRRYQGKNNVSFRRKLNKKYEVEQCDSKDPRVQRSAECLWTQMPTDSYDTCKFDVEKELGNQPHFCPNSTQSNSRIAGKLVNNYNSSYSGNYARTNRPLIRHGMQPNTKGQQNSGLYKNQSYSYSYNELIKRRRKDTYVEQLPNYNKSCLESSECCSKSTNKKFNKRGSLIKLSTSGNYSNDKFKKQGAVESSSRLDRLKLDTLRATNNKCSTNCKIVNNFGARSGLYFAGKPRFTNIKENVTNFCDSNLINSDTSNALRRVRGNTSALSNSEKRKCCKKTYENGFFVNGFKVNTNINFTFKNSELSYGNCRVTYKKTKKVTNNQPYYLYEGEIYVPILNRYSKGLLSYSVEGNFPKGPDTGLKLWISGWIKISGACNSTEVDVESCIRPDGFYIRTGDNDILSVETQEIFKFDATDSTLNYGKCKTKYKSAPEILSDILADPTIQYLFYSYNNSPYVPVVPNLLLLGEVFIKDVVEGRIRVYNGKNTGSDRITFDDCP